MKQFNNTKKGQVTVFIIIGIVVLFAAGIVLLLSSQLSQEKPELAPTLDTIPSQAQPYRDYVEDCVQDLVKQATHKLSYQGGYINTEPFARLSMDPNNPTALTAVGVPIPYWYYTDRNQQEAFQIPPLTGTNQLSISSQISSFVNDNLDDCLGDFESFQRTGVVVEQERSVPRTETYINDQGVTSIVTYPMRITSEGSENEFRIEKYRADYDTPLKKLYELAEDVIIYEAATSFLEKTAMNGISQRASEDPDEGIPPMYSFVEFEECVPKFWSIDQARSVVEEVIGMHIPFLRIENTKFDEVTIQGNYEPKLREYMQDAFNDFKISATGDNEYPEVEVDFQSTFGLDTFSINDMQHGVVKVERLEGPIPKIGTVPGIPALCMNDYSFYYTMKSPVLMTLTDTSKEENNLIFNVPIQLAIIDNNERTPYEANNSWLEPIREYNDENADIANIDVCSDDFKTGETKTFRAIDRFTGEPIPFASVEYQCGLMGEMCSVGATNKHGVLRTPVSECGSGVLQVKHPDYMGNASGVQLMDGKQTEFNITLTPLKEVNVTLVSYSAEVIRNDSISQSEDMVAIQMEELGLSESDLPYCMLQSTAAMPVTGGVAYGNYYKYNYKTGIFPSSYLMWEHSAQSNTIKVASGKYHMQIQYFTDYPVTIPKGTTVVDNDHMDPVKIPDRDVTLDMAPLGGSVIDFEITEEQFRDGDFTEIQIPVLDFNKPETIMAVGYNGADYINCSDRFSSKLKPKLV
jgi:hypothetical protein